MSPELVGIIGIVVLLALFALRMQVGLSMLMVGFLGYCYLASTQAGLTKLGIDPYATASAYSLSVIPLFVLMGMFLSYGGLGRDLYQAVDAWMGHLRGGLAIATIGACAAFAAVSGSTTATAATMGTVALPEMKRYNYKDSLATACVAAGGTLGILIPPSVILVLYGILTEEPIGKLLIAGILPGILQAVLFMVTIYLQVKQNPSLAPLRPEAAFREKLVSLRKVWPVPALFLLAMGGIYFGVFTPTEGGAVGAFGAFIFFLAMGHFSRKNLIGSLDQAARTTAMIFIIVIGATVFGHFLAVTKIPFELSGFIAGLGVSRYVVMALILFLLIALGCFMEGIAILVLTMPILYPLVTGLGFDGVWFGVIMVVMLNIGLVTPPVGVNVYVTAGVAKDVPLMTIFRGVIPFWIAMIACAILLVAFPQIATFLPSLMH
jgi:tripartite ATP-independent transporter DctM subunit